MKRTRLCALLALCLALCLLPCAAWAAVNDKFTDEDSGLNFIVRLESSSGGTVGVSSGDYTRASYTIPARVTHNGVTYDVANIGVDAFKGCENLARVTISDGVMSISDRAFKNCTSLKRVTIPGSVMTIGQEAFSGCTGLVSVTIPDGVTGISGATFYGCTSLASVTIPYGVTIISNAAFYGCTSLASVTIPDSMQVIDKDAFGYCKSLTSVTIPDSVIRIDDHAFASCKRLTGDVAVPGSVTALGTGVFDGCSDEDLSVCIELGEKDHRYQSYEGMASDVWYRYAPATNLRWDGTTARWDGIAMPNVQYEVVLYGQNSVKPLHAEVTTGTSFDFAETMAEDPDKYYLFNVQVRDPEGEETDIESSVYATSYTTAPIPQIALTAIIRSGATTANLYYTSDSVGEAYHALGKKPETIATGLPCQEGENYIAVEGLPVGEKTLYLIVKRTDGLNLSEPLKVEIPAYTKYITLVVNNGRYGSTSGGGKIVYGKPVTAVATPKAGCRFLRWEEDGETVSTKATYTFTATDNRRLTAVFEKVHTHAWDAWSYDDTLHWQDCTDDCPVIDNVEKQGYGEHEYDAAGKCTTCGYDSSLVNYYTAVEIGPVLGVPGTAYDTGEKVIEKLTDVLVKGSGVSARNLSVFDVQLLLSQDGKTWQKATAANFPAGGVTVTIPYPEGTNGKAYTFSAAHMFTTTSTRLGTVAGGIEHPAVRKLADGLEFTINGCSPVAIAWKPIAPPENLPQTGDESHLGIWLALLAVSLGALAVVIWKRRATAKS